MKELILLSIMFLLFAMSIIFRSKPRHKRQIKTLENACVVQAVIKKEKEDYQKAIKKFKKAKPNKRLNHV